MSHKLQRTIRLFYQAILHRILKPALNNSGNEDLTQVQFSCLRFVNYHPEPSVGMIASGLGISDAAAAKLVDRLVRKRLLTREEDPEDRRVLKIKLTKAGEDLLNDVCASEARCFTAILDKIPPENLKALEIGMVQFLKAALEESEQIDEICLKCGWGHELDCPGNIFCRELTGHDKERL